MYGKDMKKLTFGLDFDDTITKNEKMFISIINAITKNGGEVYIVTARQKNGWCEDLRRFSEQMELTVIFTGTKAKRDVADIDIWIDDFPLAITHDFKETGWSPSESTKKDIR